MAASDWGGPAEKKRVRPALPASCEDLFHQTGLGRFFLSLETGTPAHALLSNRRLERAIGVIYRPESERLSHYFHTRLSQQFDAVIHMEETDAVEPLSGIETWPEQELPETFPTGV